LYDNDERLASQAATTMCERGFENLFMLSGGKWGWAGLPRVSGGLIESREQGLRELEIGKSWIFSSECFYL